MGISESFFMINEVKTHRFSKRWSCDSVKLISTGFNHCFLNFESYFLGIPQKLSFCEYSAVREAWQTYIDVLIITYENRIPSRDTILHRL